MTAQCNCNNCSMHLEFEAMDAGKTITCPQCGMETVLYLPQAPIAVPDPAKSTGKVLHGASAHVECLREVRATSCYKTLRSVLGSIFHVAEFVVGLVTVLAAVAVAVSSGAEYGITAGGKTVIAVGLLLGAAVIIGLVHALHQASLLLVDIADCSVRLVARENAEVDGLIGERASRFGM